MTRRFVRFRRTYLRRATSTAVRCCGLSNCFTRNAVCESPVSWPSFVGQLS